VLVDDIQHESNDAVLIALRQARKPHDVLAQAASDVLAVFFLVILTALPPSRQAARR
jgi:hypothetical protein